MANALSHDATAAAEEEIRFHEEEDHHHGDGGTLLGFWIYMMSDALIFAVLFAAYGVYGRAYAAGPSGADLFELEVVAIATAILLVSSITYGMAMLAMERGRTGGTLAWLAVTGVLGLGFLSTTAYEFHHLIEIGASWQRSAFLSAFFTLVGTHALHVMIGCLWLFVLMAQVARHGLIEDNRRRLMCLSMFWHFLDVVWIGVFTFVYLMGVLP